MVCYPLSTKQFLTPITAQFKRVKIMSKITNVEYWSEVQAIAASLVHEAANYTDCNTLDAFDADTIRDHIYDSALNETIDGHQWVIYYAYNLDVLQHTDNAEYAADNFGSEYLADALKKGLSDLHMMLAFWALYADVSDSIGDALEEYESKLNEAEE